MAKTIKINGVTYNDVKYMQSPLASDETKMAIFHDTTDVSTPASSVKDGEWFYADGEKREGTMPVNGDVNGTISTKDGTVTVPEGYTTGGTVAIDNAAKELLIPKNIRQNVNILGVIGEMSPNEGVNAQAGSATPTKEQKTYSPEGNYTHFSQFTVEAIPAKYIDTTIDANAAVADEIKNDKKVFVNGKLVTGTHTDPAFTLANGVLSIV